MISLPSPQKFVAAAANLLPPACLLSPIRLFAPPADLNPPVITEHPPSSTVDPAYLGTGITKPRRQRVLGRNGSYHHSRFLKPIIERRRRNSWLKKQAINARPSYVQPLTTSPRPVSFGVLQQQARESVAFASANSEDKIFLEQLTKLGAQPNNLDRFEIMDETAKCLEEERARADHIIRETPQARALARKKRARLLKQRRAEQARKAAEREERVRRVAAELDLRVAEDQAYEATRRNKEQEERDGTVRRSEEERQKRVAEVRKCRERADRELMLQRLRAGQPLTPKQLENYKLAMEVTAEFKEGERRKDEARQAARSEEEQRRLAERERARLERERQLRKEEATRVLTAHQAGEAERQRLKQERQDEMQRALEAAQRRAEEMESERVAFWEQENVRRAAEEAASARRRAQEEEARRQAEFAQRQRLAEEEARQRAREQARLQAAQEQAQRAAQGAQASSPPESTNPFQEYELKWQALKGAGEHSDIPFSAFPWPVLATVQHPSELRSWDVDIFLTRRGTAGKTLKAIVKAEILRWHPDKLAGPLKKVRPDHRDSVREGGEIIAKILNNFMENVTQRG